jgi:hypothetical protein
MSKLDNIRNILAKFHRNSCYPDASPEEIEGGMKAILGELFDSDLKLRIAKENSENDCWGENQCEDGICEGCSDEQKGDLERAQKAIDIIILNALGVIETEEEEEEEEIDEEAEAAKDEFTPVIFPPAAPALAVPYGIVIVAPGTGTNHPTFVKPND